MGASAGRDGPADPIVVFSSDPSLARAMEATVGRSRPIVVVAQAPGAVRWPADGLGTVVVDVGPGDRGPAYEEVRRHHAGRLVLIVDPGEPAEQLPPDGACLTVSRPFAVADLIDALSPTPPGRPPWRPGRRELLVVAAAVPLLLLAWFVVGLLQSARDLNAAATATRAELGRVDAALAAGDPGQAAAALQAARRGLGRADAVARRRPVLLAARVPVLSTAVADLRRLLRAAHSGTRAAGHAIALYEQADSGRSAAALFRDRRVDLAVLARMRRQTDSLLAELAVAQRELRRVRGGPLQPGMARARASGLRQMGRLSDRARTLVPFLEALPSALGADRPRTYIVVLTTPVELRPSGGTPLAAVRVRVDGGRIAVQEADAGTSLHHAAVRWRAAAGNPWPAGGHFDDFSMANSSPHFPTSGEELLRAYRALTGTRPDGVLCVDPMALRALLRAGGPVTADAYGEVTADNVGRLTMRDAYDRWPDFRVRRRHNQRLVGAVLRRFLDGELLLEKTRALGPEAAERHLQAYAADPEVQALVSRAGLGGALTPADRDYLAVYTSNTNASRVDYFQRRSIDQRVELRADGSASVTRTIRVENRAPASGGFDGGRRSGYASPHGTATVATYLPPGAVLQAVRVDGRPATASVAEEAGRPFLRVASALRRGQRTTVTVAYLAPAATERVGDGMLYELVADPQPMVEPPELRIEVVAPEGMTIRPSPGWSIQGRTASRARPFARTLRDHLEVDGQ